MRSRRHKDDSNRFVVSLNMFNHIARDPLVLVTLLAVLVIYGYFIYDQFKKVTT